MILLYSEMIFLHFCCWNGLFNAMIVKVWSPRPAASASCGNLLEMQILLATPQVYWIRNSDGGGEVEGWGSGGMGGLWSVFFTSPPGDWCLLVLRTTLLGCGHRVDCQCCAVFLSEREHGICSNRMSISVYDEMHEYLLFMWPGASY